MGAAHLGDPGGEKHNRLDSPLGSYQGSTAGTISTGTQGRDKYALRTWGHEGTRVFEGRQETDHVFRTRRGLDPTLAHAPGSPALTSPLSHLSFS